jgi:molecular chaperone DnaK
MRIVNEPTAAALAYGLDKKKDETIAVYDFGGGTFDISIIRVHETVYEVLATNGDTFLGGDDIDALLCDELSAEFQRATGVVLRDHPLSWHRLRDAAEKAKKELSLGERCAVYLPRLVAEHSFSTELSRQRLEELASPLLDRSLQICSRTLEQAGLKPADVDQLVLVGGQTRMPLMRRRVEDFFGRSPAPGVNPDTVVAEGAAREGAMLRQGTGVLLLDVTPITLGINIAGNRLYPIVPKNTKIPVRREHVFTTHRDAQARARMVIIQGDNPLASENTRLGEVVLNQLSGTERFQPRIHVAFEIDASGILKVLAKDEDSGEEREAVITDSWKPEGKERAGVTPEGETVTPASGGPVPTISGAFRETELVDVLFFLHANRKTGRVEVVTGERRGTIQLTEGEISHALADDQTGPQALRTLLAIKEGQFAFHEGPLPEGPREILEPFDQLV